MPVVATCPGSKDLSVQPLPHRYVFAARTRRLGLAVERGADDERPAVLRAIKFKFRPLNAKCMAPRTSTPKKGVFPVERALLLVFFLFNSFAVYQVSEPTLAKRNASSFLSRRCIHSRNLIPFTRRRSAVVKVTTCRFRSPLAAPFLTHAIMERALGRGGAWWGVACRGAWRGGARRGALKPGCRRYRNVFRNASRTTSHPV